MPNGYVQTGTDPDTYQKQGPATDVNKAVNEAETYEMSKGNFQQAATLESNKRAYDKRMRIGQY